MTTKQTSRKNFSHNLYEFNQISEKDLPIFFEWMNRTHVAKWWDGHISKESFYKKFPKQLYDPSLKFFFVSLNGENIALLQIYNATAQQKDGWWLNEQKGTWGLDTFIADEKDLGKGHGSAYIRQFIGEFSQKLNVKKWIIDPDPSNIAAIKAYTKAGFQQKGMTNTPDGPAILMEKFT